MAPLALASAESSSALDLTGANPTSSSSSRPSRVALVMGFVFGAGPGSRPRHREDAGDRGSRGRGCAGLPRAPVQDARHLRGARLRPPPAAARRHRRVRWGRSGFFVVGALFSASIGYLGMSLAVKANVRVASAARHENGRDVGMRIAFRTGGVVGMATVGLGLLGAAIVVLGTRGTPQGPRGLRLRRRPPRDVHASRWRHLHQGRRRRRRPRRQDRGRHPRGRPAQRRDDRRQRGRQRRRLRRHGRRPLR